MPNADLTKDQNEYTPEENNSESTPFLSSLHNLCRETIPQALTPPQKKKKSLAPLLIRLLLLVLCVSVVIYSLVSLIGQMQGKNESEDTYSGISNQFWNDGGAFRPLFLDHALIASPDYAASQTLTDLEDYLKPPSYNEQFELIKAQLSALKEINDETYGYIFIDGTRIDYPLVQHSDNDYYLKHDFTGKYSGTGSIFVDYRNTAPVESNRNLILYGHHMSSGSTMFHTLDNFFDKTFFQEHPTAYIYTPDGIYEFTVFAVYKTNMYYPYIRTDFPSGSAYVDFCEEMRANSLYFRDGVTFTESSTILTLSTCTNIRKTDRIAVQAVLTRIEK